MEFKAELIDGKMIVKPIIEKKGNDIIVHAPSFQVINKLLKEEDGKRNIQPIQGELDEQGN